MENVFWAFSTSNADEIQMFLLMQEYSDTSFPVRPDWRTAELHLLMGSGTDGVASLQGRDFCRGLDERRLLEGCFPFYLCLWKKKQQLWSVFY